MRWTKKIKEMFRGRPNRNGQRKKEIGKTKTEYESLPINFNLRMLVVSDGHGCLSSEDMPECENIDVCLLLGDLSLRDIEIVREKIGNTPTYGVLGNHDGFELYDRADIENIHGKVVEVKGVRIAGIQGGFRYKDTNLFPFYTDEESIEIADSIEPADVLISHDYPKHFHGGQDWAHDGLQGITLYCEKHNVQLNIHGHSHVNMSGVLENGTNVVCCYGAQIIEVRDGEIMFEDQVNQHV